MESAKVVRDAGCVYRPLLHTKLSKEDVKKAKVELNEKQEDHSTHIARVRELLAKEKDLYPKTDDEFLLRFLRARKFNDERAANLVKDHYRYRTKNPRLFRRPIDVEPIIKNNMFNYLAHRDSQGRAIFVMKIGLWCTETYSFKEFVGAGNVLSHWVLRNPVTQINGFVGIWDFKDYSFQHFSNSCTPRLMWMLCSLMQDCFPGRFKVAYCINCPPLADVVWKLFKPLIREKYRKRMVVIGSDMSELHKYIHASVLPEEYGGVLPASDSKEALAKLLETNAEWERESKFGYRPQQATRCKNGEDDQDLIPATQEESCAA